MSKQERCYGIIRQRILDGTYGPGYRLVMDDLARELNVSPGPVREAIRRLEAEGWVVYRPNAGARVAPLDTHQWQQVMAVLAVLEGHAAALAAPLLTADDVARLRKLNDDMATCLRDVDVLGFSRANRQFHATISERCPNPFLIEMLRWTSDRLDSLRGTVFYYIPHRAWHSLEEHQQLIDLIESGADPNEIERLAREHKLHTIEAYEHGRLTHETGRIG